ncbi:MAG: hypothetical protein UY92_C0014G0085 [Candidatus Magasanikbacteria bacterium GW2011_GWA2_56_11]|uniref:Nudix hydrolase domain-containing protein n=1 Tax=Candidatus Magasanikbacteria bacterium GW2011_GWA2_56_11 TaxID=1619044 RepID=A0A0G1YF02_9BACT|nr:MAG: hypothetical protein UY92_C0014G0085 [Candidatus Magasanikbacteria bacterium GW2011_GWA2_56_11]
MQRLKKLSEEVVHDNPWWRCKHDTFARQDGAVGHYYYGETNGMVLLVPVLDNGQIVLVMQYRYLLDRVSIEFPGGGIKTGQDVLLAAKEELAQETGCRAHDFVNVGAFEPANGFIRDRAQVYLAYVVEQDQPEPDETEQIEVIYRYPDEIEEMILHGDIWDGETMAAWSLVRHYFLGQGAEIT